MAGNLTAMIASIFSGGVTPDPQFEYTTLLLPGNGTNAAQNNTFLDSSSNAFTVTRNPATGPNAPTQGTFSPFSQTGWGNYFDGDNDNLSIADNAALDFGTGTVTIEAWIFMTGNASAYRMIVQKYSGTGYELYVSNTNKLEAYLSGTTIASTSSLALNTWYHIALVRSGTGTNQTKIYINGVEEGTTTSTGNLDNTAAVYIGTTNGSANDFAGYISNVRITNIAVYTGAFTPPTSALTATQSAGTNISAITTGQTRLLTCQSNRFVDNGQGNTGNTGFPITLGGSPSVQAFSPFNPTSSWSAATNGGSGYFDGSGDYLNLTGSATGTNQWCVEFWYYPTDALTNGCIFDTRNSGPSNAGFLIRQGNAVADSTVIQWYGAGTTIGQSGLQLNAWNHVAVCRNSSNVVKVFVNGSGGTAATGITTNYSDTNTRVGAFIDSTVSPNCAKGYISGLRQVIGSSVYDPSQSTITVPTSPPTNITNTSLLLNFTNAGIYDATSKNDLETVGDAQISTAISAKWGSGCMAFDGTGDYLLVPNSPLFNFGTGDFTIEVWLYPTSSTTGGILTKRSGAVYSWLTVNYDATNKISLYVSFDGSTWGIGSTGSINVPLNSWTYVAVVRSGSSFKTYINGTQDISTTNSGSIHFSTAAMAVGASAATGISPFYGYMQDLRISNYARTITASPTAAFPTL